MHVVPTYVVNVLNDLNVLGEDFTNRIGTIVGWGRVGVEKSSSKVLLKASLRILSDEDCMNSQLAQHLKSTMMCAFSKGKDGCQVTLMEFRIRCYKC